MGKRTSIILTILSLIFIFAFAIAYAENGEYREYKVIKGDTLCDISSKEIIDPFLWPKIWKENPEIKNPCRLSIRFRARLQFWLQWEMKLKKINHCLKVIWI